LMPDYVPGLRIYMSEERYAGALARNGIGRGGTIYATPLRYENAASASSGLGLPSTAEAKISLDLPSSTSRLFSPRGAAAPGPGGAGGDPEWIYQGWLTLKQLGIRR